MIQTLVGRRDARRVSCVCLARWSSPLSPLSLSSLIIDASPDMGKKNKNTADAPLKCPHCTNSYYFESDLKTHVDKRHAGAPPDSSAVLATEGCRRCCWRASVRR